MLWVLIRIGEAILMSTHNICFYGEITKIIPKFSSNTLLICSSESIILFTVTKRLFKKFRPEIFYTSSQMHLHLMFTLCPENQLSVP